MTEESKNFASDNHALTAGMVCGLLIKHGLAAWPEIDGAGNYTDTIGIDYEDPQLELAVTFRVKVLPMEGES